MPPTPPTPAPPASPPPAFPPGTALVIGGSGGIGRAICLALARAGSAIALTYRNNAAAAATCADAVRALGVSAEAHALDLGDPDATRAVIDAIAARGPLHTVIHAAGSDIRMRWISQVTPAEWRDVMRADADGCFHLTHAALPHLRRARGSLVAVTSAGNTRYPSRDILSVAPKAAIEALVRGLAREEGRHGVRANAVAVGVVDAGIFQRLSATDLPPAWTDAARANTPLLRIGDAAEVADAVVFLASARASFVTGQTLVVDGGYSV